MIDWETIDTVTSSIPEWFWICAYIAGYLAVAKLFYAVMAWCGHEEDGGPCQEGDGPPLRVIVFFWPFVLSLLTLYGFFMLLGLFISGKWPK